MRLPIAAITLLFLVAEAAPASGRSDVPRPTRGEAWRVARIVVRDIATPFDSTYVVGSCRHPVGHRTRWCIARIEGKNLAMRLRVYVTQTPGYDFRARTRLVR